MGANGTIEHRKTITNTIGSGLRSLSTLSKPKYILEHLTTDNRFTQGEKHNILVDYIEFGRSNRAYLQFGEDQDIVSRNHAAIVKEGEGYVLQQLSEVNQTLLNGRPVNQQWFLQNGDVIQLSTTGPKIKFIVPSGISPVSPIWDQARALFKQMIKPYRNGMIGLSMVVMLAIGSFVGWEYLQGQQLEQRLTKLVEADQQIVKNINTFAAKQDSINFKFLGSLTELKVTLDENITKIDRDMRQLRSSTSSKVRRVREDIENRVRENETALRQEMESRIASLPVGDNLYEGIIQLSRDVFFLSIEFGLKNTQTGEKQVIGRGSGSGFLLSDGQFVTARHNIDFWAYGIDIGAIDLNNPTVLANLLKNNNLGDPRKPYTQIKAISNSGKSFTFTESDFIMNREQDEIYEGDVQGSSLKIAVEGQSNLDYAVATVNDTGSLDAAYDLADDLPIGQRLIIAGFPRGMGALDAEDFSDFTPIYADEEKSHPGLRSQGIIVCPLTAAAGNSGGPVLIKENGEFKVIGILTLGLYDDDGKGVAFNGIVPISNIR